MIYLILAIITNGLIGVIFKIFGLKGINSYVAITVNYLVCILVASIVLGSWAVPISNFSTPWIGLAAALGFFFPIIFNLYAISVKHLGIVISTIFQKMSLIGPVILGIAFYAELAPWNKWLGILFAIIAVILVPRNTKNNSDQTEMSSKYLIIGLMVFLGSVLIDSGLFLMERWYGAMGNNLKFVATLFFFAFIGAFAVSAYQQIKLKSSISSRDLIAGIALGIPNFFSIYFIMLALSTGMEGSVFFPINNVGILIFSVILGIILFREKMNTYRIIGFIASILAIALLSFQG